MIAIDYTTHADADVEIRSYSQHLALPAGPSPTTPPTITDRSAHDERRPPHEPAPEEPPPDVRNILLWRQARHNQRTHDCAPNPSAAPRCRFCGTDWPCDPRMNADEALAASFTSRELHPTPVPAQPTLPKRCPRIVGTAPVVDVHPEWFRPDPDSDPFGEAPPPPVSWPL